MTRIAVDTDEFPAAGRTRQWRELMCNTYLGLDCAQACEDFRFVVDGYDAEEYSFIRETSAGHDSKRLASHVRKDGVERIYIEILLSGHTLVSQGERDAVLEPGMVAFVDSTRPFRTRLGPGNDAFWIGAPKRPLVDRIPGLEDMTAVALTPSLSIDTLALDLWRGLGALDANPHSSGPFDETIAQVLDLFATTVVLSGVQRGTNCQGGTSRTIVH